MPGVFLSLDGLDGTGKTTQLRLLAEALVEDGEDVCVCRDPGGTVVGDQIREILLDSHSFMNIACETLLYMASRAQLVEEVIRPGLLDDRVVICDRFLLSTIVYQGYGAGADVEQIRRLGKFATGGVEPAWTGVLDLSVEVAAHRRASIPDRIESRSIQYHEEVRKGFHAEAARDPSRITLIDASASQDEVHERIMREVKRVLAAR